MTPAQTALALIKYYSNLLIIQYHNKPKAVQHIQALAAQVLIIEGLSPSLWDQAGGTWDIDGETWDGTPPGTLPLDASLIPLDVLNGYDIDTAVGHQLDILGKYVGVDRFWSEENLVNFFAFTDYIEIDPDADPKFGFSTYDTFENFSYNGTLTYDDIVEQKNSLSDDDFRFLIHLAILQNTCACGQGEIDQKIFALFGDQIRPESPGNMRMVYFIIGGITPLLQAIILKKLMPKPEGVMLVFVQQNTPTMFGFADYSGIIQNDEYGFSDYSDYDTTPGRCLTYEQIIPGT